MSITWANFRGYMNEVLQDIPFTFTATSAGDTDKTTAISTSIVERWDDFGENGLDFNAWLYIPAGTVEGTTMEERRISNVMPDTGKVVVYRPFGAAVPNASACEIHKFKPSDKLKAANRCLLEVYHRRDFFNHVYNTTLYGQNAYGEPDEEYNKFLYTVPSTFIEFPVIMLVDAYIGEHDGGDGESALADSSRDWKTNELVGFTVYNKTDGSSGTITANDSSTVTATLSGGTDDDWDDDDEYIVQKPDSRPMPFTDYTRVDNSGMKFYAYIPEDKLLLLQGRGPLTAFSTEAGTTELENDEARIVAYYAGYCFWDSIGQREKAEICLGKYMAFVKPKDTLSCMMKLDSSWL
jgi:hypothetical protein